MESELIGVRGRLVALSNRFDALTESLNETKLVIDRNTKSISDLEESQNYYKRAVDLLYSRSIGEVESLLNSALSFVFFDKPYKVRLDLDFSRGRKSVSIVLLDCSNPDDVFEVDLKSGSGTGVKILISFVLHCFYILSKKAYPILLLDESYSGISAQYVQRFFELVHGFCEKKNFRVVLVTHDTRFLDYSDKRYVVSDGVVQEV